MSKWTLFCLLIVITDPYKGLDYDKINVYDVNYGYPPEDSEHDTETEEESEEEDYESYSLPDSEFWETRK